ncbi:peroxiredoxin [Candidatus Rariloculus sp.]|uniref:peroxiredoxin n=1 Tax=Candidatus Rariloculus sp. TaxID=3101265 RepID=UPI003D14D541
MATPAPGEQTPAFEAEATDGKTISSEHLRGRPFVLYFYPRDNTPGCTAQSKDFRDRHAEFEHREVVVLGVSRDSLISHEKFRSKFGFPFDLISDRDETLCGLFDVIKQKNMYGKKVRGIERSTFLCDSDGVLVREWRKVKIRGHVDEVLEAVEALER